MSAVHTISCQLSFFAAIELTLSLSLIFGFALFFSSGVPILILKSVCASGQSGQVSHVSFQISRDS